MIRYFEYNPTCWVSWAWDPKMKEIPDSETGQLTEMLKFEALEMEIGDQKTK